MHAALAKLEQDDKKRHAKALEFAKEISGDAAAAAPAAPAAAAPAAGGDDDAGDAEPEAKPKPAARAAPRPALKAKPAAPAGDDDSGDAPAPTAKPPARKAPTSAGASAAPKKAAAAAAGKAGGKGEQKGDEAFTAPEPMAFEIAKEKVRTLRRRRAGAASLTVVPSCACAQMSGFISADQQANLESKKWKDKVDVATALIAKGAWYCSIRVRACLTTRGCTQWRRAGRRWCR